MSSTYDHRAGLYDAVVGSSVYLRLFWGTSPGANTSFARQALRAAGSGAFAEVGCGSLLFTSRIYDNMQAASATLIDRALPMLKRGRMRLTSAGAMPPRVKLLRADATALPVEHEAFDSVLCLNLLHVVPDPNAVVAEIGRVLAPDGRLFASVLVRCGRWSDAYLTALHRAGELGPPMTMDELVKCVEGDWGDVESVGRTGNLAFVIVRRVQT
jgi:SAM-dependent methyltransferase